MVNVYTIFVPPPGGDELYPVTFQYVHLSFDYQHTIRFKLFMQYWLVGVLIDGLCRGLRGRILRRWRGEEKKRGRGGLCWKKEMFVKCVTPPT